MSGFGAACRDSPARLRRPTPRDLRVCRYRVFIAIRSNRLEAIDKIKNTYLLDTLRVWQYPGAPDDIRAPTKVSVWRSFSRRSAARDRCRLRRRTERLAQNFMASPAMGGSELVQGLPTPPFVVAEIVKAEIAPQVLVATTSVAH